MRVPAKSDHEAFDRFVAPMQRALDCFTQSIWRRGAGSEAGSWLLTIVPDPVVRLPCSGGPDLYLAATQAFHFDDDQQHSKERKVVSDAYAYTLSESPRMDHELFAWHWHPAAGHEDPHLHVGKQHPVHSSLGRLHVPSGRIAFEEVLLFALHEFGTVARRPDARTVLNESLQAFREWRRWG